MTEGAGKEAAILELTEVLNKDLMGLQAVLDDSFDRTKPDSSQSEGAKTQDPNVLNEIRDNLHSAILGVQKMHEFVVHTVIRKVHNI